MLSLLFANPPLFALIFGGLIIAVGIHEAAHCYMADYLGDPTPRSLGRLSLNPLAHLDLTGTMVILITGLFGWGKPAPFDPYNLKNPRRDTVLIALAGPVSNLFMAFLLSLVLRFTQSPVTVNSVVYFLIGLNINLALFNLLPVPPLDGSKIFLKNPQPVTQNYLLLLLLILPLFGGHSLASLIVSPVSQFLLQILV